MRAAVFILLGLLVLLQFRLWVSDSGYRAAWRLTEQVAAQQQENAALEERNRALEAEVSDLKTGLEAVQEIARSELGMVGEGETLFQVVELDDESLDAVSGGR